MELIVVFILGTIIGSFLSVVVHRLPDIVVANIRPNADKSLNYLVLPLSFCPVCNQAIKPWNNIPLISFILLRGKSACCSNKISIRYPLLELISGGLAVICLVKFGVSTQTIAAMLLCWLLLVIAWLDATTYRLPDLLITPLIWIGLFVNTANLFTPLSGAIYAVIGSYLLTMLFIVAGKFVTGKQVMGEGDPKFIAAIGAWLGWQDLFGTVIIGCSLGALIGILNWQLRGKRRRHAFLPLGPFLAVGAIIMLFYGEIILALYLGER